MSERKISWKTIKVPEALYQRIRLLAEKTNRHMYQVIEEGIIKVELYLKRPYRKRELPRLDKCAWYVFKLANSVGAFKENPTVENWNRLMNTVSQVKERIGVNTELLETVLQRLHPGKSKEITTADKIELNDAVKLVIADIIVKMLFEETETAQ